MSSSRLTTIFFVGAITLAIRCLPNSNTEQLIAPAKPIDTESILAFGRPIALSTCELPDLELIPDIGPATARKIFKNREALLLRSQTLSQPELALVSIKGIGPANAAKIAPWITFR